MHESTIHAVGRYMLLLAVRGKRNILVQCKNYMFTKVICLCITIYKKISYVSDKFEPPMVCRQEFVKIMG